MENMRIFIFISLFSLLVPSSGSGEDIFSYFPLEIGNRWIYQTFDCTKYSDILDSAKGYSHDGYIADCLERDGSLQRELELSISDTMRIDKTIWNWAMSSDSTPYDHFSGTYELVYVESLTTTDSGDLYFLIEGTFLKYFLGSTMKISSSTPFGRSPNPEVYTKALVRYSQLPVQSIWGYDFIFSFGLGVGGVEVGGQWRLFAKDRPLIVLEKLEHSIAWPIGVGDFEEPNGYHFCISPNNPDSELKHYLGEQRTEFTALNKRSNYRTITCNAILSDERDYLSTIYVRDIGLAGYYYQNSTWDLIYSEVGGQVYRQPVPTVIELDSWGMIKSER